ncbi:MAG: DUF4998 domain-containing protein [Dysgonomonas sp.]
MKKLYNSTLILLLILFGTSCENFMDIHEEYIKGGETIYAPKADSIQFIAGKGRVMFAFWLENSPNVKTVDLYWNSRKDSLIIPVSPTAGRDSFYVTIPNLAEGAYTFDVKTTDNFGHPSLYLTEFGNSYGAFYQSSLANRRVKSIDITEKGGTINWFSALDGMIWTDVKYTKSDGTTSIVRMDSKAQSVFCPNLKAGTSFQHSSSFIPEELSIDTFSVDWEQYSGTFPAIYKYDRSSWSVLAVSDETASDGGGKNTLLDNKLDTWWHSQWDGGDAPLPHWAVIDMTSAKKITKIETYRRAGNTDAKTIQYFIGPDANADASTWTKVGETNFVSGKDNIDLLIANSSSTVPLGRYLKLVLPDSNRNPYTSIAEVYVYGD